MPVPKMDSARPENEGGEGPRQKCAQDADAHSQKAVGTAPRRLLIVEHAAQAQGPAHEHDALHAQVQVAGLLRQDLPQGAEEQGGTVGDGGNDQGDQQIQEVTHFAPSCFRKISR